MNVGVTTGNPVIAVSGEIDLASAEGFLLRSGLGWRRADRSR